MRGASNPLPSSSSASPSLPVFRTQSTKKQLQEECIMSPAPAPAVKQYLLISEFDQTLSFNDSWIVLSEMLGIGGFQEKIAGLSHIHLVQQRGELADPALPHPA